MDNSRTKTQKIQNEPGEKEKEGSMSAVSKGHRNQPKRASNDQIWKNLSNKVTVLDYKPTNKINIQTDKNQQLSKGIRGRRDNSPLQNSST